MGLFGFGKKKYEKNVTRDNEFLKDYAIKTNALLMYVEENEKIKKELNALKDDFQYTVATPEHDAKGLEKKIRKDFDALTATLQQSDWEENDVLNLIRGIRRYIVEISSSR